MKIDVVAVHPSVTVVEADGQQTNMPTAWFPMRPSAGQHWDLTLERVLNEADQIDQLNRFLAKS